MKLMAVASCAARVYLDNRRRTSRRSTQIRQYHLQSCFHFMATFFRNSSEFLIPSITRMRPYKLAHPGPESGAKAAPRRHRNLETFLFRPLNVNAALQQLGGSMHGVKNQNTAAFFRPTSMIRQDVSRWW